MYASQDYSTTAIQLGFVTSEQIIPDVMIVMSTRDCEDVMRLSLFLKNTKPALQSRALTWQESFEDTIQRCIMGNIGSRFGVWMQNKNRCILSCAVFILTTKNGSCESTNFT